MNGAHPATNSASVSLASVGSNAPGATTPGKFFVMFARSAVQRAPSGSSWTQSAVNLGTSWLSASAKAVSSMAASVAVSEDSCSKAGRSFVFLANSSENALKPTEVNSGLKFTSVPGGFALCDEPQAVTANAAHSVSSANLFFIALPVRAHYRTTRYVLRQR